MTVDVHGNPLPSMGFGYMYHELHHPKHHQRRSAPRYSQTRPKATGQTSCCLWLIPTMQCHLKLQKDSSHPPGNSRQTFQSRHTEEGIQTQVWDLSLHIIQCSRVCCACTKCPKILHIGFIPYSNERNKAIKLSSYKNQIYLLYSAKCIDIATPLVPTEESYSRQLFCTDWL